jgi:hypothetical protein
MLEPMRASRAGVALSSVLSVLLASSGARALDAATCVQAADSGQQLRLAGRLLAAQDKLVACADPSCPPVVRVACSDWLNDIRKSIPSVVFAAKVKVERCGGGAGEMRDLTDVDVRLDGRLLARRLDGRAVPIDPGTHVLRFELPDGSAAPREETIQLREGEKLREVSAVLERRPLVPCPAPGASSTLVGAYVASSVALLSLGGFAYFALSSHAKFRDLSRTCAPYCDSQQTGPFLLEQDVADACLGVGLAAAAVAAWLWLTPRASPVALQPTGRGGALRLSF